ncbi:hypothetical protein [Streptantibioticus silvisoli]|uniref:HNH endonuclease n=1 Tax=Streptantibioticus silvisoli TaxID=2705255 RepID=A0ABT6VUF0_9ACTN|nr:hypothetical protein [Streptantibioticus silvisoli]MDI5962105.1 hypothetical protein [Streptantibioticus silvisoli]
MNVNGEELPSWRDESRGTMIRCALWLLAEVGAGNVFTKTELREAFPETSQIDRRLRDLRDRGWLIGTNREDPTLKPSEQRFVQRGADVWKPGQGRAAAGRTASISAAQRQETFAADGYLCRVCGIAGGETYENGWETAQLDVARRETLLPGGGKRTMLMTECKKCRVARRESEADVAGVISELDGLSSFERDHFAQWVAADARDLSVLERIWGRYRVLPAEARKVVQDAANSR